ncbi:MAG: hypothetical protein RLZZ292_3136 [Bacteroidota bacterium]|jgi:hypothetical protein
MKKPKIKSEFNHLVTQFGLDCKDNQYPLLTNWLVQHPIIIADDVSELMLAKVEPKLSLKIGAWLEEDLKMKLLSLIFLLADFSEDQKIDIFYERSIVADINGVEVGGKVDCLVSSLTGFAVPNKPYFFMQEFKKSKGDKQDPEGQMLAAMIAAQNLNNNQKPLYGAFVVGEFWYFTVLESVNYARSEALHLTNGKQLRQVIATLKKLKEIILTDLVESK